MDFLHLVNHPAVRQWMAESLAAFFLFGGLVALAVGLGLYFNSAQTLRFFDLINGWVSLRRASRPLELQRDTRQPVRQYRRWIAALFVFGGLVALYGLTLKFDARAAIHLFNLGTYRPGFSSWTVESARWVLIVGNLAAIAVGIALGFFPSVVDRLESAGSRWFSERQAAKGADTLHTPLDRRVMDHPRASGLVMAFFGLILIGTFGVMLFGR